MSVSNTVNDLGNQAVSSNTAEEQRQPKVVTLIYRDGQFERPEDVHASMGDTIRFICDSDLDDCEMVITLDKEFFQPAIFKNNDSPVMLMNNLEAPSEYQCRFFGTRNGMPYPYKGPAGGFIIP